MASKKKEKARSQKNAAPPARPPRVPFSLFFKTKIASPAFVVFIIALIVRLAHIAAFRHNPFFDSPIIDAQMYDSRAMNIINGTLPDKIFYQAPLYSYFLAAIYFVFGHNLLVPRIFQAVLGAFSCSLVFLIGKKALDERAGKIAGIAAALYGPLVYFDCELLRSNLTVFLALAMLMLMLFWDEKRKIAYAAAAGAALGLSAITSENILIFTPVAALWFFVKSGKWPGATAAFLLCASLMILPVTIRNYSVEKDFVPVSPQGGMNFYIGNSADAKRLMGLQPGIEWDKMAFMPREELGANAKPSEWSSWFFKKAMEDIRADPGGWLRLTGWKFMLFWTGEELDPNNDMAWARNNSIVAKLLIFRVWFFWLPFGLVVPFFVYGLLCGGHRGNGALLAGFVFSYMLSVVLFHVRARYRIPVAPVMLPLAAYGAIRFFETLKSRNAIRKHAWRIAVALAAMLLASDGVADAGFARNFPTEYFIAKSCSEKKDERKAVEYYEIALGKWPGSAELMHDYGQSLIRLGRGAEGVAWIEKARDAAPDSAFIRKNLGQMYRKEADAQSSKEAASALINMAVAEYEAAERLDRFDTSIKYDLALLYERAGRKADFRRKLNEFINLAKNSKGEEEWVRISRKMLEGGAPRQPGSKSSTPGSQDAQKPPDAAASLDAAQYHMRGGNYEAAYREIQASIAADPNSGSAYALLGNYFKKTRNLPEAEKAYLKAIELDPQNVLALNNLANTYRDTARYEEAELYYQKALSLAPDNPVIKKNRAEMQEKR